MRRLSWFKFASHYARGTNKVCECKMHVKSTWSPIWLQMDKVSLGLFSKTGRPWRSECSQPLIISYVKTCMNRKSLKQHLVEAMVTHYTRGSVTTLMNLEVCWDGLWTLSFELSQFHGHGYWLVCEVALGMERLLSHPLVGIENQNSIVTCKNHLAIPQGTQVSMCNMLM